VTTVPRYNVFVSHNRRQKAWVRSVVALLRDRGLKVFFDEDSIAPGDDVVRSLERAIESSETLVLVLSRSSVFSKWVAFETALRLYEDPDSSLHRLIPILVEPVDRTMIRPAVRRLDAVDLTDPTRRQSEFDHFLKSLGLDAATTNELPPWPDASSVDELYVADVQTIIRWGWSGEHLLDQLIQLDYEVLSDLTAEHEGHAAQWAPVFMDHPETWRLLVTPDKQVVGYWHFVPLFPEDFEQALAGTLRDGSITTDRVQVFELPGEYPIYFVSFCLLPRYRRTKAFTLLLEALGEVILNLASEGIFLDRVCTNAFTASGVAMCKMFGLSLRQPHREHGQIYVGAMAQIMDSTPWQHHSRLRAAYAARLSSFSNEQ